MKRRTSFTPDEAQQLIAEYGDSNLRDLAQRYHADPDVVRAAISANGGTVRTSSRIYAAQNEKRRASGAWKYGALQRYLDQGVPFGIAAKMANLDGVPEDVVLERLDKFRIGLPLADNQTTLQLAIDNGVEV